MLLRRAFVVVAASAVGCGSPPAADAPTVDSAVDANGPMDTGLDTGWIPDNPPSLWDTDYEAPGDQTAVPTFSPPPGTYTAPIRVTISTTTPGAVIYFTTDGTEPNTGAPKYTMPLDIANGVTVKALAIAPGLVQSKVMVGSYAFGKGTTAHPVALTPPGGSYAVEQNVSLATETAGALICYTLDGSDPLCDPTPACTAGLAYATPLAITPTTSGRTVSARACKSGFFPASITRATYKTP